MTEQRAPGVYIEEIQFASTPIQGASASTVGFVSITGRGPLLGPLTSFADFERVATSNLGEHLPLAVRGFFENGGRCCFISQIRATDPLESGLTALDAEAISLICCPDDATIQAAATMAAHCEKRKDRICILQSAVPMVPIATHQPPVRSSYAAYYYPWITVTSLNGSSTVTIPPCGHLAGIYAQTDENRGVWVAPSGTPLVGVTALSQNLTNAESDELNSRGIDPIRSFPAEGIRAWGSRTTTDRDSDYKYIPVRRFMIFLEQSISRGLQWAVFEPNGQPLWAGIRSCIETFLAGVWKQGALQGSEEQQAFFVRCDSTTMTPIDLNNGRLVCIVGVAPVRPAEFVIIQISIWTQYPPSH